MGLGKVSAWFYLLRPWSYAATFVPFLAAAALGSPSAHWLRWTFGLVVGALFQATVNILNTWGDERSGVDAVPGAIRTTPQIHDGLISLRAVFAAAVVCATLASAAGILLCFYPTLSADGATVWRFDAGVLAAGALGCLGATNYSTGVRFKYRGLGVPFVAFLMGPLEVFVASSLLVPRFSCEWTLFLLWTLPVAALVSAILHGNDMRDRTTDRIAGIVTLASSLSPRGALAFYCICHVLPYAICAVLAALAAARTDCAVTAVPFLLPFLCLPLTLRTLRVATLTWRENPECPKWIRLERASGAIHLLFGILYAGATAVCRTAMEGT